MDETIRLLSSQLGDNRVKTEVILSDHVQSASRGQAKIFYIATTSTELVKVVKLARELNLDYKVIGMGTKVLFIDEVFDGLLIKNRTDAIKVAGVKGKVSASGIGVEEALILADSGVSLAGLAEFAQAQKLEVVPEFKTYPGTIGGNLYEFPAIKDKTQLIQVLDSEDEIEEKKPSELKQSDIIISVTLKFRA